MRYDVLLYTRGIAKEEDYNWYRCPAYVNRKELHGYLQPLIDYVRSCTRETNRIWEKQYLFLNLENCSVIIRLYESEYTDFCGRNIFVMEGIACSSDDRNFMFNDLVNVVRYFEESQKNIQRRGESHVIEIPALVNPKAGGTVDEAGIYAELVSFIQRCSTVCNVFVGNTESIPSYLFEWYHFANINSESEVICRHVKQEITERKNYDVQMEMTMGKKWIAEYALKACDRSGDSVYARLENDCFDTKIEYAELYAEHRLLDHIMNVLWG